jgi:hypothetical protein
MLKSASTKAAKLLALSSKKSSHGLETVLTLNKLSGRSIASLSTQNFQDWAFRGPCTQSSDASKVIFESLFLQIIHPHKTLL